MALYFALLGLQLLFQIGFLGRNVVVIPRFLLLPNIIAFAKIKV
jgi:hypothetical protein